MKKLITASTSATHAGSENEPIFTATDIVTILSQVRALKNCNIALEPDRFGSLQLIVGEEQYQLIE